MPVFGADDPSALRLFFRSLLPNFNPAEPQPEGAVGGEGQDGIDLRSVRTNYPFKTVLSRVALP
jgi:hypothetical protein